MTEVRLSWAEAQIAAFVGCQRRLRGMARQLGEPSGRPSGDLWGLDVEAAGAELAVAKLLDTYWFDSGGPDRGDVDSYEVRYSRRFDGDLIIRPGDDDERVFVLVVGAIPVYQVVGYKHARDGKQEAYRWQGDPSRPPCFKVPRGELNPVGDLLYIRERL